LKLSILIIEDDQVINRIMSQYVRKMGHDVISANCWSDADKYLESHEPDLIVTDVRLPDGDSLALLPKLVENQPVIVLTAYGSVKDAVEAMKAGAFEYLIKPVSPDEFTLVVERALENAALQSDHMFCKQRLKEKEGSASFMVGISPTLEEMKSMISAVAPSTMSVLILGESGTGKELVARAIHDNSDRTKRNFVAVDCCTLQEKLFESELFGHERGSFSGADRQKKGLIEGAEGGTIFLDEIGEIDESIQVKLLRVLETGTFRRVGGTKDLKSNVRVVAATNRNLDTMIREGSFRADLYYRINGFTITTPPLRDRRDDIPHLVEYFIKNHNFSRRINKSVSPEAMRRLVSYEWPGNVRELKNIVERSIILSLDKKTIKPEHLTFSQATTSTGPSVNLTFDHDPTLAEIEESYVKQALDKYSGHRSTVARILGISERHVYRLVKKYGIG